ncbi:CAP domain-containing protein [Sporolactobacillus shoreicorticis]|uniref:CAP domain-containing protein n=1 Tax=Sporolactobacillus shoreicorticis TaxID=1923877 RepID=A0ABW5S4S9_9BACL|nr:CAP domain-containing protein [Sporolactobacillus shoreicorticis]MCO7126277.1 CAP domain-containing protein [Sporolactobacillus shoreicorticis]
MRKTNVIIFAIAVIVFAGTFLISLVSLPSDNTTSSSSKNRQMSMTAHKTFKVPKSGIHSLMGKTEKQILRTLGKPERTDPSKFGYRWFIYGKASEKYVQIGIDNETNRVTTIYALGKKLKTNPFAIGDESQKIYEKVPIADEVSLTYRGTKIDFELNEEDMMVRPLMKFGKIWVQLNFDHLSDRLIGIRYMTTEVLAMQHPYSMTYQGNLPETPTLTEAQWTAVNQSEDREIFDVSNVLRLRFKKKMLQWNDAAQQAAYKHSKEMKMKNYFSHGSKWSGDLKTRLDRENINFQMAGENIAAKYPDALAVSLGWLNSVDHRKNLLNDDFTELGVGSYQNYYTQDFVRPMIP